MEMTVGEITEAATKAFSSVSNSTTTTTTTTTNSEVSANNATTYLL